MNTANSQFLLIILLTTLFALVVGCNDESIPAASLEQPDVTDISANASLSVSDENPGGPDAGEGSLKLIDLDKNSKFLTFAYTPEFWMQQDFEESVAVNAYTMTSGNDAPERDPKVWTLEGSNDGGTSWETIVTESEVTFSSRNKVNIYRLDSDATYSSYRLSITEIAGETTLLQISEWRLLHYGE